MDLSYGARESGLRYWLGNLADLNLETVLMAIPEIFLPFARPHTHKRNILPVLFHDIGAILAVFAIVPVMIVAAVPIVITLFPMMLLSRHDDRRN
jgi:predicted branched-subunit amino acid permease